MYRPVILAAALILSAIGLYVVAFKLPSRSLCRDMTCIEFAGKGMYRLEEPYTDDLNVYRALFTGGSSRVRIEATRVPRAESELRLQASVAQMKALFEKAPAPYPGEVTQAVVCDPNFVPTYNTREIPGGTLHYFVGYLNSRLTFGSCSREEAVYRSISAFLSCPSSLLIRVEFIVPVAQAQKNEDILTSFVSSLRCRP